MKDNVRARSKDRPTVTREEITAGLCRLGLPKGALVLMHSSLKSFGYVEGGADAVIDGVLEALGQEGTLVVPTLTFAGFEQSRPYFDARSQPSETGAITEQLRRRTGARRSLHPLSSVAAIGKEAERITGRHGQTPCGPESPYTFVADHPRGYTLFVGAGFGSNSLFHVAEERVAPEYLTYDVEPDVHVTDMEGTTSVGPFKRYACARLGIRRYLQKIEAPFYEAGAVSEVRIGASQVRLLPAAANVYQSAKMLRERPEWILTHGEKP